MNTKFSLTVLVLAALATLGGAIVVGLSDSAEETFAEEAKEVQVAAEEHGGEKIAEKATEGSEADPGKKAELPAIEPKRTAKGACLVDESAIEDIQNAKREVAAREQAVKKLEAELQAKEKALKEELVRIEAVRDEIKQLNQVTVAQNEEKIAKLVETFENMSPRSAAQVVANIDENLAVEAMRRLSSIKLAKILSALDSKKSAVLTERMAGVVRAPIRETASKITDGAAVATLSVKGGESDANHKQQQPTGDALRKQPEPALGK